MGVPCRGLGLRVTQDPPHHRQALAAHHRFRSERVAEVVDTSVLCTESKMTSDCAITP